MNKFRVENLSEKIIPISALIMGLIVFLFQSLIYRWLNVAMGATVFNQIAILVSTYFFFGLGALYSLKIPRGKLFGHIFLLILLASLALSWPKLPLWISGNLPNHEFRFVLTLVLTSPFFFLFGSALPQYNNDSKGSSFSEIFFWFHIGAGFFLLIWNTFFIAKLGIGFSLSLILFLTTLIVIADLLSKKESKPLVEPHPFVWSGEVFYLSILNGFVQAFLIYLNNRIQGPFASSFTFYLVTSIFSLALAGIFVSKFQTNKENYKKYILNYLPIVLIWCLCLSFVLPYFFQAISSQIPLLVTLSRGLVVVIMFLPPLFFMGLLVPAYADEVTKDYNVLALNSWGNVLGIFFFISLLTIGIGTKTLLVLIGILFFTSSLIKKEKVSTVNSILLVLLVLSIPSLFFHFSFRFYESPSLFYKSLKKGKIAQTKNFWGAQVDILDLPRGKTLVIDGYKSVRLKNALSQSSPERLLGKYQEKLVQNKNSALILGVGSGATVVSLAQTFKKVVGVEIHPVIYKIKEIFKIGFQDLKKFNNTKIVFDDGFPFLSRSSEKFDLIVNNVPTPQLSAASTLWTSDFYRMVKKHLRDEGAYSQWIDGAINREAILVILKTLQKEFQDCYLALVTSTYGNVVCFKEKKDTMIRSFDGPIFHIENWTTLKFSENPNSLDKPMLEYSLNPMLSQAWIKKKDWFLLDLLKISPVENLDEICQSLKLVKASKGGGLPSFCLE